LYSSDTASSSGNSCAQLGHLIVVGIHQYLFQITKSFIKKSR
jgi:hypothetical protein